MKCPRCSEKMEKHSDDMMDQGLTSLFIPGVSGYAPPSEEKWAAGERCVVCQCQNDDCSVDFVHVWLE
jgi:hypothetical protein